MTPAGVAVEAPGAAAPQPRDVYSVEQRNIQFEPYVMIIPVGASVGFPNRETVRHSAAAIVRAIVRAIVDLATALDMETTAEGVEDADQLSELRDQGCSSIQGYWFSRPLNAAAAGAYIAAEGVTLAA